MAGRLENLIKKYKNKRILAIIGAGHEEEIIDLIKRPKISYSFNIG